MEKIPVMFFHSVGIKNPKWIKNFLTLEITIFEDQLKYFSKHYNVINLKKYWEITNGISDPVKNPLILTFDDGYLDNWQYAYPLLKKYGLKGTIFISPEFVDKRNIVRPNLEDLLENKVNEKDLMQWGFLSWEEMRIMEASGVIDIQSHTFTHTKYPVSDNLVDFHHPGADCLYYISNNFPERKPYYIDDVDFEKLLPYGYPVFEMRSSVIARKIKINPGFIDFCVDIFKDLNFYNYKFESAFKLIKEKYNIYQKNDSLIISKESEQEYQDRVRHEIFDSKRIIEKNLNKTVDFLCWPHGDNNNILHNMAIEAGYLMTTKGNNKDIKETEKTRIPERIGANFSSWFKRQKTIFKVKALSDKTPYFELLSLFRHLRY